MWEASPCCQGEEQRGEGAGAVGRGEAPKPGSDVTVLSRHEETAEAGSSVRMKAVSAGISHGHSVPIQSPIGPASARLGEPRSGTDGSSRRQPCSWPGPALGTMPVTCQGRSRCCNDTSLSSAGTQASSLGDLLKSCSSHLQCTLGFGGPCAQALLCVCFTPL